MKFIFNGLGKIIFSLSIICILVLLCVQILNYNDNDIIYTSKKNTSISFNKTSEDKKGFIVLENMTPEYKEIEILLNGDSIGSFYNNEISFSVYHNDIIEMDTTEYKKDIIIKIIRVSDNIELPKLNTILNISESIGFLGKVQLK